MSCPNRTLLLHYFSACQTVHNYIRLYKALIGARSNQVRRAGNLVSRELC